MKKTKKIYKLISMLALAMMVAWNMPLTVQGAPPSVADCLETNKGCEQLETDQNPDINTGEQPEEQQAEQQQTEQVSPSSSNLFLNFIKLLAALAIVLVLIYFLSKLANRKNKLFTKHSTLENLGGITLGPQKSMQVVRIGKHFYIVGVGDNVELLTEITDQKTIEALMDKAESTDLNPTNLVTYMMGKKRNEQESTEKEDFSAHFKKELNTLKSGRKQSISRYMDEGDKRNE